MPITDRKRRERERRREDILDSARRLISAAGYDNVTMQDIADAVELSKGSLYLTFKDKDDIVAALVGRSLDELDRIIAEELGAAGTAIEKLERLARAYWRFHVEKPEHFPSLTLVSRIASKAGSRGPAGEIAGRLMKLESILTRTFEEGIEEGSIRRGIDVPRLVGLVTVLVNSFLEKLAELPRAPGPLLGFGSDELIKQFFDILIFYVKEA